MTISLFGIENVKEHNFMVEIGNKIIKFWIDSEEVQLKYDCQAIIHQISDYCYVENDKTFTQRTFFKTFKKFENVTCIVNMIRAFAVSFPFFEVDPTKTYITTKFEVKPINPEPLKNLDSNFSDRLLLDSDINLKEQPQMYFLKKELTENYTQEISKLFNSGSLQKFQVTDNAEEKIFFYVPFEYKQPTTKTKLWDLIIEDFDTAVKNQANNNLWK